MKTEAMEVACSSWVRWAVAGSASWAKAKSMIASEIPSMVVYYISKLSSREKRMLLPPNIVDDSTQILWDSSRLVSISFDQAPSFFLVYLVLRSEL